MSTFNLEQIEKKPFGTRKNGKFIRATSFYIIPHQFKTYYPVVVLFEDGSSYHYSMSGQPEMDDTLVLEMCDEMTPKPLVSYLLDYGDYLGGAQKDLESLHHSINSSLVIGILKVTRDSDGKYSIENLKK